MKMYFALFLATMWLGTGMVSAQGVAEHNPQKCFSAEHESMQRANNPAMGSLDDFERWISPLVEAYQSEASSNKVTVTQVIPVVFHVIHNGEAVGSGSNLSASQVNSQLNQLNADFGGGGQAVDTEIQFCAAQTASNGGLMPEPGINRINRNTAGWSAPPYGKCQGPNINLNYIEGTIKPQSQWDPSKYLNIWIMPLKCGLLGYAQFPDQSGLAGLNNSGGSADTDGVVVEVSSVGSTNNPSPIGSGPYTRGRTLTHEVGHWLGLRHIWGDGGCSVDDYCADTPASDGPNYGCPTTVSCGSVDQVENFMDYTDDLCMDRYTADQKARIQVVMANSPRRTSLATSTTCDPGTGDPGDGGGGGGSGGPGNGNGNGNGKPKRVDMPNLLADLEAFPNPTASDLRIQFNSELDGKGNMIVLDLMGRVIMENDLIIQRGGNSLVLDMSTLATGTYLVHLKVEQETEVLRIVKTH